jgi:hypothetical protein
MPWRPRHPAWREAKNHSVPIPYQISVRFGSFSVHSRSHLFFYNQSIKLNPERAIAVFKTAALNHSATLPAASDYRLTSPDTRAENLISFLILTGWRSGNFIGTAALPRNGCTGVQSPARM